MAESPHNACSECGKAVPTDSKHQICPACLMAQAFASRTVDGNVDSSQEPPPSPEEIADKFPQFEVTECLGRGGMGVVYKARQKSLDRWVAIKVLAPERLHEERFAEHFEQEAKTLAKMSHPNIVTVFDHGETEGLFYIVMEFIDGVNLRDLIHESTMEPAQALNIIPPICDALQYAHDKGIVHRDIKPENLLIDREGRVKIADFGIASLIGATGEQSGTPPYMAPEQDAHTSIDHRADIYALGVVLYEMLTGERPNSPLDLPSSRMGGIQLDIRIDDIVLRALSKEPERRYRTANEFRTVVENITPESSPAPPVTPSTTSGSQIDQRFGQGLGIVIIIAGALNGLTSIASFVIVHFVRRNISLETNLLLSPHLSSPGLTPNAAFPGSMLGVIVILSILYTLTVSTLCIIGGHHMYRGSSQPWALTGAIACCLTPLWWPLGLFIGIAAIVVWVLEKDSSATINRQSYSQATAKEGPRLSLLAVFAFAMQLLFPATFILLVIIGNVK